MICAPCGGEDDSTIRPLYANEVMLEGGEVKIPREREFGIRNPRKIADPRLPSKKEVGEHNRPIRTVVPKRVVCSCSNVAGSGSR